MSPDPRVHVGVCAVVFHPDKLKHMLFQHRVGSGEYASDGHGTWAFPGGWLDFGESPEEAAAREVKEELDLDVAARAPMGASCNVSENGKFQIVTLFFECALIDPLQIPKIVEPEKVDALAWMTMEDAFERPLFAATEGYLKELAR